MLKYSASDCGVMMGELAKVCLISSNSFWWMLSHLKSLSSFNLSKDEKTLVFLDKLEINLHKKFTLPNKDCSSFLFRGGDVSSTTLVLFLSISIPFLWMTKPKNSPTKTPKAHFRGFIYKPCYLILSNESFKCSIWSIFGCDLITTSSIYTCMKSLIKSWKNKFIALW